MNILTSPTEKMDAEYADQAVRMAKKWLANPRIWSRGAVAKAHGSLVVSLTVPCRKLKRRVLGLPEEGGAR